MIQRFSEVPDQLGMAIVFVTPENNLLWDFFDGKFQFGDCKNVRYSRKSVTSENLCSLIACFQECSEEFDVILTCEERVYDAVLENLGETGNRSGNSVHVVNMDIVDNPEDATIGAFLLHELAEMLNKSPDLDDEIDEIVQEFEGKCQRPVLHSVAFY